MTTLQSLIALAQKVLEAYPIEITDLQIVQGETIKTVWKVETPTGALCLKRLRRSLEKLLFSIEAQRYIKERGGNVPGIIENRQGHPYVVWKGQVYVLYEWIDGFQLNFANPSDFGDALIGLAKFHRFSNGFVPPYELLASSKLGRWPDQYASMLQRFMDWKQIAKQQDNPSYRAYLNTVDAMIDLATLAISHLSRSRYSELTADPLLPSVVLCHQDYGKGNALRTSEGVWILDLDNVTYDLRARDLRKIILKRMEKKGQWDKQVMDWILKTYEQETPLTRDERQMVYIDCLFPHDFHGTVKNLFKKNKSVAPAKIQQTAQLEQSKIAVLEDLIDSYKEGA